MCNGSSSFISFCRDFSKPKFAYKACLDEVGAADILEVENAALKDRDHEFLLSAFSSRVNNDHVRIANKASGIYVPHPEKLGTFAVQRYQHEPDNQVLVLSRGFNSASKEITRKP